MAEQTNKRPRDAVGARETILNAAETVFAEHGFDGARIDGIALQAGYNKSLIFQYFGDKLGLYAEVIRRADAQTRGLQSQALAALFEKEAITEPARIRNLLETWLNAYYDYLVEHPNISRIYLWELAEGWQTLSQILTERDFADVDAFGLLLEKLQTAKILRSDRNPMMQIVMSVFLCPFFLGLTPLYRVLLPEVDLTSPAARERERAYVVDFVLRNLTVSAFEANDEGK